MSDVKDFVIENGVLKKYVGPGGDVVIPEGVMEIGEDAFCRYNLEPIVTGIVFPTSLISIGEDAFLGCSTLKSITIPKNVKNIGAWAFCMVNFQELVLMGKPKIGKAAFSHKDPWTTKITAPDSVAVIPYMNDWSSCEDYKIINSVRAAIGAKHTAREADLKWIVNKLMSRMKSAVPTFFKTITAEELDFLAKYQGITARNADELLRLVEDRPDIKTQLLGIIQSNVTLDQRLEQDEHKADLTINRTIKRGKLLDDTWNVFQSKTPEQIKKEWGAESGADDLTITKYKGEDISFVIPAVIGGKKVTRLADDSFRATSSLESGKKSAYNKKMYKTKAVIVQDGITYIGKMAFAGCVFMTDICLPDTVTEIDVDAFKDCHKLTIHTPAGSYAETYAKEHNIPFVEE